MNETKLRELYAMYSANERGQGGKSHNCDYMVLEDCIKLFTKDKVLAIKPALIKVAFAMSKMTVIEESDITNSIKSYEKLLYVEFLEFLARIAELYF